MRWDWMGRKGMSYGVEVFVWVCLNKGDGIKGRGWDRIGWNWKEKG
jgi:hypothetical protein